MKNSRNLIRNRSFCAKQELLQHEQQEYVDTGILIHANHQFPQNQYFQLNGQYEMLNRKNRIKTYVKSPNHLSRQRLLTRQSSKQKPIKKQYSMNILPIQLNIQDKKHNNKDQFLNKEIIRQHNLMNILNNLKKVQSIPRLQKIITSKPKPVKLKRKIQVKNYKADVFMKYKMNKDQDRISQLNRVVSQEIYLKIIKKNKI